MLATAAHSPFVPSMAAVVQLTDCDSSSGLCDGAQVSVAKQRSRNPHWGKMRSAKTLHRRDGGRWPHLPTNLHRQLLASRVRLAPHPEPANASPSTAAERTTTCASFTWPWGTSITPRPKRRARRSRRRERFHRTILESSTRSLSERVPTRH